MGGWMWVWLTVGRGLKGGVLQQQEEYKWEHQQEGLKGRVLHQQEEYKREHQRVGQLVNQLCQGQ